MKYHLIFALIAVISAICKFNNLQIIYLETPTCSSCDDCLKSDRFWS